MTIFKHPASLRDPAGYLVKCGNRLIRVIRPEFVKMYRSLLASQWLNECCQSGTIITFRIMHEREAVELLGSEANTCLCLEHNVIGFPSYPSEWPLEMLCAAAELTLRLSNETLQQGVGLKDATPCNILFQGPHPIFVDLLSFEVRDRHDYTWIAHGQFARSFLLPALLDAHYGISCHKTFLAHRDGLEPEYVYRLLSPLSRLKPPFLGNVTIPVLLSSRAIKQSCDIYAPKRISDPDKAQFVLQTLYSRLASATQKASTRKQPRNIWSAYNKTCTYTAVDTKQKTSFVERFLKESHPMRVLDVGCNTGIYSFLAADHGAEVVSIDLDPEVVGSLWYRAKKERANILPLVVNLAQPTPALGWRNNETLSFLERAEGYFDAVFMMAVVHHLLVTERIPLEEIIIQASRMTKEWLVIEYIGPEDPQFRSLLRGRDALYEYFKQSVFERELNKYFEIIRQEKIVGIGRSLYLARSRNAS